jgi:two-component system sensor histidine kinase VanS
VNVATAPREPGASVRLKLTLSYAGFLMFAGVLMLAAVWVVVLRYIPAGVIARAHPSWWFFFSRSDPLNGFGLTAAMVLGALLVFGLVGGWFLAGQMLSPLTRITDATRKVANGSLSHRIALEGRQDEFRELADSFDAMLARLEAQVAEQQRFAANASHELRTPLATTQTLLEVAQQDPGGDTEEIFERLRVVNARAIELTQALLVLSRADQRSFAVEPVDLSLVAEEAIEALVPFAEAHDVSIETAGETSSTSGSHALLLQMTTNLLQNAIVHNLPRAGAVWITTNVDAGRVQLTVENTGPVLSSERVATLVEPFQRGSERARSDDSGVGLGLAIVESIVRAHDGTLTLTPRPAGGLQVTVELPEAAHQTAGLRGVPDVHSVDGAVERERRSVVVVHRDG